MTFSQDFLVLRLGFCATSGKSASAARFWHGIARFGRHKMLKSRLMGLSKAVLRWYITLAPRGICPGCLLRKPPDRIDRRPWALASIRFGFGFSKACNGLSRGGAAR